MPRLNLLRSVKWGISSVVNWGVVNNNFSSSQVTLHLIETKNSVPETYAHIIIKTTHNCCQWISARSRRPRHRNRSGTDACAASVAFVAWVETRDMPDLDTPCWHTSVRQSVCPFVRRYEYRRSRDAACFNTDVIKWRVNRKPSSAGREDGPWRHV